MPDRATWPLLPVDTFEPYFSIFLGSFYSPFSSAFGRESGTPVASIFSCYLMFNSGIPAMVNSSAGLSAPATSRETAASRFSIGPVASLLVIVVKLSVVFDPNWNGVLPFTADDRADDVDPLVESP